MTKVKICKDFKMNQKTIYQEFCKIHRKGVKKCWSKEEK